MKFKYTSKNERDTFSLAQNFESEKVKLPKDITEGKKVRLKGEGKSDSYGRKGDLYLVVHLKIVYLQIKHILKRLLLFCMQHIF